MAIKKRQPVLAGTLFMKWRILLEQSILPTWPCWQY